MSVIPQAACSVDEAVLPLNWLVGRRYSERMNRERGLIMRVGYQKECKIESEV
jgi:hypothetical protein